MPREGDRKKGFQRKSFTACSLVLGTCRKLAPRASDIRNASPSSSVACLDLSSQVQTAGELRSSRLCMYPDRSPAPQCRVDALAPGFSHGGNDQGLTENPLRLSMYIFLPRTLESLCILREIHDQHDTRLPRGSSPALKAEMQNIRLQMCISLVCISSIKSAESRKPRYNIYRRCSSTQNSVWKTYPACR